MDGCIHKCECSDHDFKSKGGAAFFGSRAAHPVSQNGPFCSEKEEWADLKSLQTLVVAWYPRKDSNLRQKD